MARLPRELVETNIKGLFFRDISERERAEALDPRDDDTEFSQIHRLWRDVICDENGDLFDDITDDPECVKDIPLRLNLTISDELTRLFSADPKS